MATSATHGKIDIDDNYYTKPPREFYKAAALNYNP